MPNAHEVMFEPLNSDPVAVAEIRRIVESLEVQTIVETGTFYGHSTALFSTLGSEVHGVEISDFYLRETRKRVGDAVQLHHGASQDVLPGLLPRLRGEPLLFYLDAHWRDPWPLPDELSSIATACFDRAVVVVDDVCVPGRDFAYDEHGDVDAVRARILDAVAGVGRDVRSYYNGGGAGPRPTGKLYAGPARLLDPWLEAWTTIEGSERYSNLAP